MMLTETTPIAEGSLPVAQFRDHLRLGSGFSDDDVQTPLLAAHLRAAIAAIEARTGKVLIEREFAARTATWREARRQPLPVAPVGAITEVVLLDRAGGETPVPEGWHLLPDAHCPSLQADSGTALPAIPTDGAARVGFLAGFGPEWEDLPADLAQAVMMLAAHYYTYRMDAPGQGAPLPLGVSALLERFRAMRIFLGARA